MKPASMLRSLSGVSSEQLREAQQFAKGVEEVMLHAVGQVLQFRKEKRKRVIEGKVVKQQRV